MGGAILALVEIAMRVLTAPSAGAYRETFPLMAFLSLLLYILCGIAAGIISYRIMKFIVSKGGLRLKQLQFDSCQMTLCIVVMIFFHTALFIHEKFLSDNSSILFVLSDIGLLCFCFATFFVIYKAFAKIQGKSRLTITYLAFVFSLNVFLEMVLYRDPLLIPANIRTVTIIDYALLLTGCIAFHLLVRSASLLFINWINRTHFNRVGRSTAFILIMIVIGIVFIINIRKAPPSFSSNNGVSVTDGNNNVILIVMDTTRRDHLSCYGYQKKTTPNLDMLSRESLLCTNAYSTSSWTLPSHASIMTGLYPLQHGAHFSVNSNEISLFHLPFSINILSDNFTTLAEIMSRQGYNTAGVVASVLCHKSFGIAQGFDYYHDSFQKVSHDLNHYIVFRIASKLIALNKIFNSRGYGNTKRATEINQLAFSWLNQNYREPFFLFLNYFDPHATYQPPSPYDRLYEGKEYFRHILENHGGFWNIYPAVMNNNHQLTDKERAYFLSQYDGEIAYLDYYIGALIEKLKSLKIYDKSMIIITADHGELLGEHNLMDHSKTLYEELTNIPLIIKYPASLKKIGTFELPVSLIDIMPTVLSTIGISRPDNIEGEPITQVPAKRKIFAELNRSTRWIELLGSRFDRDLRAIYNGDFKYIWASNGKNELYNTKKDPKESHNLVQEMTDIASAMNRDLQSRIELLEPSKAIKKAPKASTPIKDKLRFLGYIQ